MPAEYPKQRLNIFLMKPDVGVLNMPTSPI
jgi:hypothetical protein